MTKTLLRAGALGLLLAAGAWTPCWAQSDARAAEYKVKAAFLYRFASYVEWPARALASPADPLVIGVMGADALAEELVHTVADRTIGGHPVAIRKLRRGEPVAGLHMLFIGNSEGGGRIAEALAAAKGKAVLTVTESEDGFALGSVINLVVLDDKIRFDVALSQAESGNLKVSARLLSVARKVISSTP